MNVGRALGAIAAWAARHARPTIAIALILVAACTFAATRAPIDSGVDSLIETDHPAYQDTEEVQRAFGDDPIVILVKGDLEQILQPPDLLRIMNLEACISGIVPEGATPLPGPCEELAELQPGQLVAGPATFLNQAATGISEEFIRRIEGVRQRADRAAAEARRRALQGGASVEQAEQAAERAGRQLVSDFLAGILGLASRYGLSGVPDLGDPAFIAAVVFDPNEPPGTPKDRFAYLFPGPDAAQIIVRLRHDLGDGERSRAIELIQQAVSYERPQSRCSLAPDGRAQPCFALDGGEYVLSGAPIVIEALSESLRNALIVLLAVAVAVMAFVLAAVFRSTRRLLPLALALGSCALTFGIWSIAGGRFSIAAIAALPILTGLAVDYAIQLHARYNEVAEDPRRAAELGGPIIGTACIATAAAFLILVAAPTPMVREFGLMLALGVVVTYVFSLLVGTAALAVLPAGAPAAPYGRSARRIRSLARTVLATADARPYRVIAVGLIVASAGWVASARMDTVTDITELAPRGIPEVENLLTLQEETGVSGQIDVMVSTPDVTDPELIHWMAGFRERVLEAGGYDPNSPDCDAAEICPGPSLVDFLGASQQGLGVSEQGPGDVERELGRERIQGVIESIPPEQIRGVVEVDPETGELGESVNVPLLIGLMPLERQQEIVDEIRAAVDPPADSDPGSAELPAGAEVHVGGLTVIAAEAASELESSRHLLVAAGLAAVGLVLLLVVRSLIGTAVVLVPILLATGWSGALLGVMSVSLNPISAVLGVLVIAIGTEFAVILAARFRQERDAGDSSVPAALARTYARTGAAVLASGVTVIAGFAVLIASDVRMLREFGLVTVVDLAVALGGVMLVLPATLVVGERLRGRSKR